MAFRMWHGYYSLPLIKAYDLKEQQMEQKDTFQSSLLRQRAWPDLRSQTRQLLKKHLYLLRRWTPSKRNLPFCTDTTGRYPEDNPLLVKAPSSENASSFESATTGLPCLEATVWENICKLSNQDDSRTWQCPPHYWYCRLERFKE